MDLLKIAIIQSKIIWEDRSKNQSIFEDQILSIDADVDVIILPEMFSTGFTMNTSIAEKMDGERVMWMKKMAAKKTAAICGSLIIQDNGKYYNRLLWIDQDGNINHYDKRHLFSYAGEHQYFSPGKSKKVVEHKGWRFLLNVCYDLRFPVSMRNENDYDAIVLVANWPDTRAIHWKTLLQARAIENQAYVLACNRVGVDANDLNYQGDSSIIKPDGTVIQSIEKESGIIVETISLEELKQYRERFAFGADADKFTLN
jgi:predicted amidohydrolase